MRNSRARRGVPRALALLSSAAPGVAGRGVQFLALAWLATLVTPERYGAFSVLQMLVVGAASVVGSTAGITANTAAAVGRRGAGALATIVAMVRLRAAFLVTNAVVSFFVVTGGFVVLAQPSSPGQLVPVVIAAALGGAVPVAEVVVGVLAGTGRAAAAAVLDGLRGGGGAVAALLIGVLVDGAAAVVGLIVVDVVIVVVVLVLGFRLPRPSLPTFGRVDDGAAAGVAANLLGQVAVWVVIGAVGAAGGVVALGVYGVAVRFASVITVAPVYLGKVVVRHFVEEADGPREWTPRSFLVTVVSLCVLGAAASLLLLVVGFPGLVADYPGVVPVTVAVLLVTSVRALLICIGQVCVARRAWRTWVVADLLACCVTSIAVGVAVTVGAPLTALVLASGSGHVAGIAVRLVGLRLLRTGRALDAEAGR